MDRVRRALSIPEGLEPFSPFPLGYPAQERMQQDRFEQGRIHCVS